MYVLVTELAPLQIIAIPTVKVPVTEPPIVKVVPEIEEEVEVAAIALM